MEVARHNGTGLQCAGGASHYPNVNLFSLQMQHLSGFLQKHLEGCKPSVPCLQAGHCRHFRTFAVTCKLVFACFAWRSMVAPLQDRLQAGTRIATALDAGMLVAKDAVGANKIIMLLSDGDVDNADCTLPFKPRCFVAPGPVSPCLYEEHMLTASGRCLGMPGQFVLVCLSQGVQASVQQAQCCPYQHGAQGHPYPLFQTCWGLGDVLAHDLHFSAHSRRGSVLSDLCC